MLAGMIVEREVMRSWPVYSVRPRVLKASVGDERGRMGARANVREKVVGETRHAAGSGRRGGG